MSNPSSGDQTQGPSKATEENLEDVFSDVADAAHQLTELPDLARIEAWASSVLAIWAEADDVVGIDHYFLAWLDKTAHPNASALAAAVTRLLVGPAEPAKVLRAWQVTQNGTVSLGIGFLLEDGSQYSLLGDLEQDELTSLIVAPGPDELFDGSEDLINPDPADIIESANRLVAAWKVLLGGDAEIPESVYVNGALAARRLGDIVGTDLTALFRPELDVELSDQEVAQLAEDEAEANAWALSVLDGAGVGAGKEAPAVLSHPLMPVEIVTYPAAEREAFIALEWADWLGVILQVGRAEVGQVLDPSMLVDFVNQCPEVTSTIPKGDRSYYEWAFSLVLPLWRDAGVLGANNELLPDGGQRLVSAARRAWR